MDCMRTLSRARILRAATNHGVETIEVVCLPENVGMQNLAKKFHAQFAFEQNSLTGRLKARPPTAFTLFQEASSDALDRSTSTKPTMRSVHWSITTRTQCVCGTADSHRNRSRLHRLSSA